MKLIMNGKVQVEKYLKRVSPCDGSDPQKTLTWLHHVSAMPYPKEVVRRTVEGYLSDYLRWVSKEWSVLRKKKTSKIVNAAFEQTQRNAQFFSP